MRVAFPSDEVVQAIGPIDGIEAVVWNPRERDANSSEQASLDAVFFAHSSGGRQVWDRIKACERVRLVQLPSAGFEHALPFVPDAVTLANARGVHDSRVAELTLGLIIASFRALPRFVESQRVQKWEPFHHTRTVADSHALIVGYGSIGEAIAQRLRASEVSVEGVARTARIAPDGTTVHAMAELQSLLPRFDVVVIATPYDATTHHLVNADFLAAMPDDALVVNIGRGGCIDTEALLHEVKTGRIRAALDVTEPEPLPEGHPLWSEPNVIVTPHIAGMTPLTDQRYIQLARAQLLALRDGKDLVNVVKEAGE